MHASSRLVALRFCGDQATATVFASAAALRLRAAPVRPRVAAAGRLASPPPGLISALLLASHGCASPVGPGEGLELGEGPVGVNSDASTASAPCLGRHPSVGSLLCFGAADRPPLRIAALKPPALTEQTRPRRRGLICKSPASAESLERPRCHKPPCCSVVQSRPIKEACLSFCCEMTPSSVHHGAHRLLSNTRWRKFPDTVAPGRPVGLTMSFQFP